MSELGEIPSQPNTITTGGDRKWIIPQEIRGRWQKLRRVTSILLLLILYGTPWLKINDEPFMRLSFLSSSFVMFGSHILIYEFYHFALLALLLVGTLFLASALYGRIWCGYACPQTIFIEQILGRVDRFFEGPASKRLAERGKVFTGSERLKRHVLKVLKQLTYGLISFSFAFSLVALFTGPEHILEARSTAVFWALAILTALAWFDAGYWREQFCHIVCPYARFQSVMQDQATRTIGYDAYRGEPRGRSGESRGDCIDCGLCVRVCPSGIDIRQGATQLECIACARCIDACDGVMTNIHRSPGLIRYDAAQMFHWPESTQKPLDPPARPKIFRPRVLFYGLALTFILLVGVTEYLRRVPFHVRVLSVPGAKPWFQSGERVQNLATLKIGNQSDRPVTYQISIKESNQDKDIKIDSPTIVGPIKIGEELSVPFVVSAGPNVRQGDVLQYVIQEQNGGEYKYVLEKKWVGPSK